MSSFKDQAAQICTEYREGTETQSGSANELAWPMLKPDKVQGLRGLVMDTYRAVLMPTDDIAGVPKLEVVVDAYVRIYEQYANVYNDAVLEKSTSDALLVPDLLQQQEQLCTDGHAAMTSIVEFLESSDGISMIASADELSSRIRKEAQQEAARQQRCSCPGCYSFSQVLSDFRGWVSDCIPCI